MRRVFVIFFLGFLGGVLGCRFNYAIAHKQVEMVIPLGFAIPAMQAITSAMFIQAASREQRVVIAVTTSVATAIAGAVTTLFLV
jgi:hypothetical protein